MIISLCFLLLPPGRIEDALHQLRVAEKTDPLSPLVHQPLAYVLTSAVRYEEAAGHCQKLPADFPGKSGDLARVRLGQGRIGEAIEILTEADNRGLTGDLARDYLGNAYARAGRREEAEKLAAAASSNPFQQALIFAGLGDKTALWKLWIARLCLGLFGSAGYSHGRNWRCFAAIRE